MAYNANIPQPTDELKDSQPQILANFNYLSGWDSVNHIPFNSGSGIDGKHLYLQFPTVQTMDVSTASGEVAVYSKTGITTVPALFFRGQSNGTVPSAGFTESAASSNGWTMLPSGILIKWGLGATTTVGSNVKTFPTGSTIPVFNNAFIVLICNSSSSNPTASINVVSWNATQFTVGTTASPVQYSYIAIGN